MQARTRAMRHISRRFCAGAAESMQSAQKISNNRMIINEVLLDIKELDQETEFKHALLPSQKLSYVGAPLGLNTQRGLESTPMIYRCDDRYFESVGDLGWTIWDCGDLIVPVGFQEMNQEEYVKNVGEACRRIADKVEEEALGGNFVLNIGGSGNIAYGTVAGALRARPNTCVFWVDAEPDCLLPGLEHEKDIDSFITAGHLGLWNVNELPGWEWFEPRLHAGSLVFVGIRQISRNERRIMEAIGAHIISRYELDKYGVGTVMKNSMKRVNPFQNKPIHLHIDIDVMDPTEAPSTVKHINGGLTYREAKFITEFIASTGHLVSMDMCELNAHVLQGVAHDEPDEQLITIENCPKNIDIFTRKQLARNPKKTLEMGWSLVRSALGETII